MTVFNDAMHNTQKSIDWTSRVFMLVDKKDVFANYKSHNRIRGKLSSYDSLRDDYSPIYKARI